MDPLRRDHCVRRAMWEEAVEQPAVRILNAHRIMSISTVRPDGWPQTTVVGYTNQGFDLFFMIVRSSQKFANIQADDRISIAVAVEPSEISQLQAVYAGAYAREITDENERREAWRLLTMRHANLSGFQMPDGQAAFMRAQCRFVSVLDYTQGPGHREQLVVDENGMPGEAKFGRDAWGGTA